MENTEKLMEDILQKVTTIQSKHAEIDGLKAEIAALRTTEGVKAGQLSDAMSKAEQAQAEAEKGRQELAAYIEKTKSELPRMGKAKRSAFAAAAEHPEVKAALASKKGRAEVELEFEVFGQKDFVSDMATPPTFQQPARTASLRSDSLLAKMPVSKIRQSSVSEIIYDDTVSDAVTTVVEGAEAGKISQKPVNKTFAAIGLRAFYEMSVPMLMLNEAGAFEEAGAQINNRLTAEFHRQVVYGRGAAFDEFDGLAATASSAQNLISVNKTFAAGAFVGASVVTGRTLVKFAAKHGLYNGMGLTIAASANYNGTYTIDKVDDFSVLLPVGSPLVAEAGAAWTGSAISPFRDSVFNPNLADLANVVKTMLTVDGRVPNMILLNPNDATTFIRNEKDLNGNYMFRDMAAFEAKTGLMVLEVPEMQRGKMLVGNFGAPSLRFFLFEGSPFINNSAATGRLEITQATQHVGNFIRDIVAFKGTMYPVMVCTRPKEFAYDDIALAIAEIAKP